MRTISLTLLVVLSTLGVGTALGACTQTSGVLTFGSVRINDQDTSCTTDQSGTGYVYHYESAQSTTSVEETTTGVRVTYYESSWDESYQSGATSWAGHGGGNTVALTRGNEGVAVGGGRGESFGTSGCYQQVGVGTSLALAGLYHYQAVNGWPEAAECVVELP